MNVPEGKRRQGIGPRTNTTLKVNVSNLNLKDLYVALKD